VLAGVQERRREHLLQRVVLPHFGIGQRFIAMTRRQLELERRAVDADGEPWWLRALRINEIEHEAVISGGHFGQVEGDSESMRPAARPGVTCPGLDPGPILL